MKESDVISNKEFTLFQCNGTAYKARALPYLEALKWLDVVNSLNRYDEQLAQSIGDLEKMGEIKMAYAEALAECVLDYNPEWDKDALRGEVSLDQLSSAFMRLKQLNDPFEKIQLQESIKLSERLQNLPPEVLSQAMKMTASQ